MRTGESAVLDEILSCFPVFGLAWPHGCRLWRTERSSELGCRETNNKGTKTAPFLWLTQYMHSIGFRLPMSWDTIQSKAPLCCPPCALACACLRDEEASAAGLAGRVVTGCMASGAGTV